MSRAGRAVRGVAWVACVLVLLAILVPAALLWFTLAPAHETLRIRGLHHPVSVTLDEHGIPRIEAADLVDAAAATGFLHARDRMLQMELMRRVGSGRISEIAGPAGLGVDRMMRTLGLRHLAEAAYPNLPPATRDLLDAYARGVNAAIDRRGRFLSPEFLLLGRPEPWTPADTLLWGRLMGLTLAGNWHTEIARLAASATNPISRLLLLWPDHAGIPGPQAAMHDPLLQSLASELDRTLPRFPAPYTLPEEASDEWAVDGAHSSTGAPLLAGDPHLALGFPSIWYLLRIDVPGYTLTGASAPGTPFVIIGQNGHIAWTFTSSSADCQDLFIETTLPDGRYGTPDGPKPFETHTETIHVRGTPDVTMTVRTSRHGPVISDILPAAQTGGRVIAAAMENLRPEDAAAGVAALDAAHDIDEAGRAAPLISTPVQNLLVADRQRIALFTTGHVPVRRSGDGSVPGDGATGVNDWIGDASGAALPTIVAPASGHLLNGNERTAPADFAVFMGRDWPAPWRADRIRTLLDSKPTHDLADFTHMQHDPVSAFAQHLLPILLARVPAAAADSLRGKALALLRNWDGSMTRDAPQPLIFNAWIQRFVKIVMDQDRLPQSVAGPWEDSAEMFLQPGSDWCAAGCDTTLALSLDAVLAELSAAHEADPASWRWGTVHLAVFDNAFLHAIPLVRHFARGTVPIAGDDSTLLRGGSAELGDMEASHGGSYRGVYDLADPERSRFIVSPGQSGNWLSSNAWNLMQDWSDGTNMTIEHTPRHVAATVTIEP